MMDNTFEVTFLGTNGPCAYNSKKRMKYGSNTLCIAVKAGETTLLFDAGSGIIGFGELNDYQQKHKHMFLTHYHIDHISGLLFFYDFFDPQRKIDMYGGGDGKSDFRDIVDRFLSPPHHPVGLEEFRADLTFHTVSPQMPIPLPGGVMVEAYQLSHPGLTLGYRVTYGGKSFCLCMDIELADHQNDTGLIEFTQNADLLVLDSFFGMRKSHPGWGHSNLQECAEWAARVNAKKLALCHYHYTDDDDDIEVIEKEAQKIFPNTFAAADFMRVEL